MVGTGVDPVTSRFSDDFRWFPMTAVNLPGTAYCRSAAIFGLCHIAHWRPRLTAVFQCFWHGSGTAEGEPDLAHRPRAGADPVRGDTTDGPTAEADQTQADGGQGSVARCPEGLGGDACGVVTMVRVLLRASPRGRRSSEAAHRDLELACPHHRSRVIERSTRWSTPVIGRPIVLSYAPQLEHAVGAGTLAT